MAVTTNDWQLLGLMGAIGLFFGSIVVYVEIMTRRHRPRRPHAR